MAPENTSSAPPAQPPPSAEPALDTDGEEEVLTEEGAEPESGAEGEAGDSESEPKAPPADAPAKPETYDIDGEQVSLDDLKLGYKNIQRAVKTMREAKELKAASEDALRGIVEKTDSTLMEAFTGYYQGDREKAYAHVVKWAAKVVNDHVAFEGMSEDKREALRAKIEAESHKKRADAYEAEKKTAAQKENKKHWEAALTEAATKSGLPTDPDTIEDLARVIVNAKAAGFKLTAVEAAEKLKKEYRKRQSRLWAAANPEEVPPEFLEKVRKRDLETVKKNRTAPAKTASAQSGDTIRLPTRSASY